MAHGNLILGKARGSIGDVTLSQYNGKQVSRARARVVGNPKSAAQQVQRMVAASVAKAASLFGDIVDHSFQGEKVKAGSLAAFRKDNMNLLRQYALAQINGQESTAAFVIKGVNYAQPARFLMSRGTLSFPSYTVSSANGGRIGYAGIPSVLDGAPTTVAQWLAALNSNYSDVTAKFAAFLAAFGCVPGDQLTMCVMGYSEEIAHAGEEAGNSITNFSYARNVFLTAPLTADATTWLDITGTAASFTANVVDVARSTMGGTALYFNYTVESEGEHYSVMNMTLGNLPVGNHVAGCCLIRSAKVNGQWKRSTAHLELVSGRSLVQAYASDVFPTYGAQAQESFESNLYLDNALSEGATSNSATSGDFKSLTHVTLMENVYNNAASILNNGRAVSAQQNVSSSPTIVQAIFDTNFDLDPTNVHSENGVVATCTKLGANKFMLQVKATGAAVEAGAIAYVLPYGYSWVSASAANEMGQYICIEISE